MAATGARRWQQFLQELVMVAGTSASAYFLIRYLLSRLDLDPESQKREEQRRKSAAILRRLDNDEESDEDASRGGSSKRGRRQRKGDLTLDQYEQSIAVNVIAPDDIPVSFEDIGGLDHIITELKESVIYPLTMPHLFSSNSSLLTAPTGVLLHGPPGCGKTMLAKALAHESGACFINLPISSLTSKWYGDSNKMVNAVFSLARKLQPSIVFVDEIDSLLGTRTSGEHEASGMVKAEFMTQWDGLTSVNAAGEPQRIVVLGATNRKDEIDPAILRRMPKKFEVRVPNDDQRKRILSLTLKDTKVDRDNFNLAHLLFDMAEDKMSGSGIKAACIEAVKRPVMEVIRQKLANGESLQSIDSVEPHEVRGLRTSDFSCFTGDDKGKTVSRPNFSSVMAEPPE